MDTTTRPPVSSWGSTVREAARDLLPSLIGLVPFALVIGVTAQQTHAGLLGGVVGGFLLFTGTAQLSALGLVHHGAPVASVVLAVAVINARLPLYAAAMEEHFRRQPGWFRWIGPHFLVDQTFATATARDDLDDPDRFRRYWLAAGAVLSVVWLTVIAVGTRLGHWATAGSPVLAFAPVALFVPMLVRRIPHRPSAVAALVAGLTTAVAHVGGLLPPGVPVLVGAVSGTVAGAVTGAVTGAAAATSEATS